METALGPLIAKLAEFGPGFIFAGVFITLYVIERKKNDNLSKKLYELGMESLKVDMEHTKASASMEKTLDLVTRSLSRDVHHDPR